MEENTRIVNGFELHMEPLEVEIGSGKGRRPMWPFANMRLLETYYVVEKARWNSARMAISYLHKTTDMRFRTMEMPTGIKRMRVQRVA